MGCLVIFLHPLSCVSAQQENPQLLDCTRAGSQLVGTFSDAPAVGRLVQFHDVKNTWQQWVVLPPDDQGLVDGHWQGKTVSTDFLGSAPPTVTPLLCSATDVPYNDAYSISGNSCPQHNIVVDNGPQVDVKEIYHDRSNLRVIFRVIMQKWFAAGIALLNERLTLSVDDKILEVIPVRGYEPQTVRIDLRLQPQQHVVLFGLLDSGGLFKDQLETPQGTICI